MSSFSSLLFSNVYRQALWLAHIPVPVFFFSWSVAVQEVECHVTQRQVISCDSHLSHSLGSERDSSTWAWKGGKCWSGRQHIFRGECGWSQRRGVTKRQKLGCFKIIQPPCLSWLSAHTRWWCFFSCQAASLTRISDRIWHHETIPYLSVQL